MKTIEELLQNKSFKTLFQEILDDATEYCRDEYDFDKDSFLKDSDFGMEGLVNEYWNELKVFITQSEKVNLIDALTILFKNN